MVEGDQEKIFQFNCKVGPCQHLSGKDHPLSRLANIRIFFPLKTLENHMYFGILAQNGLMYHNII